MSTTRAVWIFIIALTAVRLSILSTTDLEFDEAHYWMWSERLAPAYFSKGPAIAFVIRASTAVFGSNEFGVRFFSPLLAAGTSLLLFYFARRLFSATAGLWAVVALNVTPIFNIGAFAIAGKSRARLWFSSRRGSFVSGPAFSGLLAISLSGPCLGGHCKLATRQSAVQGPVFDVVWVTHISLLLASFTKQGRST